MKHLVELAAVSDQALATALDEATALTPYAVEYRYPGEYAPVTPDDITRAMALADHVRDKIEAVLRDKLDM